MQQTHKEMKEQFRDWLYQMQIRVQKLRCDAMMIVFNFLFNLKLYDYGP